MAPLAFETVSFEFGTSDTHTATNKKYSPSSPQSPLTFLGGVPMAREKNTRVVRKSNFSEHIYTLLMNNSCASHFAETPSI
ncbi:hypothetical protein K7432_013741 [Basidiobolus ranarum]|uniref:Uncharacterized protein n=1 Tax=Basidiobolus ranarum TaxID=34480 RepID=A0ABR2WIT7_9FUNG